MIPIDGAPILTVAELRAAERACGDPAGLMERAGQGMADAVRRLAAGAEALILCGPGDNGGYGYVAACRLREWGRPVRVAACAEPATDLARAAAARWGGDVAPLGAAVPAPVLVDALFGTGLTHALPDAANAALHRLAAAARLAIAVGLPSGVAADDGTILSEPPCMELTLALGAASPAHLLQPGAGFCGTLRFLDLGLAAVSKVRVMASPCLPEPGAGSHKYNRGTVAVVGGAMPGASELAAEAALRAGAGYVLHLGDPRNAPPHALVRRAWSPRALADRRIGAVVIGPGLGRDEAARTRLRTVLATGSPVVLDADALHMLDPDAKRAAATLLTPHDGEFAALFGGGPGSRIDRARAAATRSGAVVILKGVATVVAAPDGRIAVAGAGNPWLSTAGTGDVLAGICGAMLSAMVDPFDAACAAVRLHARAAAACGRSFIADDLVRALSTVR